MHMKNESVIEIVTLKNGPNETNAIHKISMLLCFFIEKRQEKPLGYSSEKIALVEDEKTINKDEINPELPNLFFFKCLKNLMITEFGDIYQVTIY